jgi:hypothetical protein
LDAILVPIHRGIEDRRVDHLRFAVKLARRTKAHLLVVFSAPAYRDQVGREFDRVNPSDVTLIDLPLNARPEGMEFKTAEVPGPVDCPARDVGRKRNLGLMLARMLGWRHVLFLDDDVHRWLPWRFHADVRLAAASLSEGQQVAVGWAATRSPDNSVVCHANRLAGSTQGIFIGGGALLVDAQRTESFFPDVYNEDWLFLADALRTRRVGRAGTVRQRRSPLFRDPKKAACQEFGDVLGEGLFSLLHNNHDFLPATRASHWHGVIESRRSFLLRVDSELRSKLWPPAWPWTIERARACVQAALDQHRQDWPVVLADYVQRWEDDKGRWARQLNGLPDLRSVGDALRHLELHDLADVGG